MSNGMDFFSLDVTLDEKWELIEAEFGITGFGVIVKLLQRIYGGQGYYVEWTNEVALLFARKVGVGGSVVSEIVGAAIKRGIFDATLYEKYGVLTSRGIQNRYFKAVSRRKSVEVIREYLLAEPTHFLENVNILFKNANISQKNADISKQRKGKERKVEDSKGNNMRQISEANLPERVSKIITAFNEICVALPKVMRITPKRNTRIKELLKAYSEKELLEAFKKVQASNFLTGKKTDWKASFDWLISGDNIAKVLEGQYDNRTGNAGAATSFETDEFFEAALKNSYKNMEEEN